MKEKKDLLISENRATTQQVVELLKQETSRNDLVYGVDLFTGEVFGFKGEGITYRRRKGDPEEKGTDLISIKTNEVEGKNTASHASEMLEHLETIFEKIEKEEITIAPEMGFTLAGGGSYFLAGYILDDDGDLGLLLARNVVGELLLEEYPFQMTPTDPKDLQIKMKEVFENYLGEGDNLEKMLRDLLE